MNAEEQLSKLRQPRLVNPRKEKEKKILTAALLAIATLLSVLFLIYAFTKKLEAEKQAKITFELKIEAEQAKQEAENFRKISIAAQAMAEMQRIEAERQMAISKQALLECKKSKQ